MKKLILFLILAVSLASFGQGSYGVYRQKNIIFEGNSLSNYAVNSGALFGHYVPLGVYNNLTATFHPLVFTSFAISGRNQTQINASITTNITPLAKLHDLIIVWEGTNDCYTNGLSGQAAYDNLATYITTVKGYGATVIVCTVIARDYVSDPADLMTRIGDYNTLVRSNAATLGFTVCDLAADPLFDARADASNATYYNADKIHQATAGQDRVITLLTATATTVLSAETTTMPPDNNDNNYWNQILIIISIAGVGYYLIKEKEPEYKIAA